MCGAIQMGHMCNLVWTKKWSATNSIHIELMLKLHDPALKPCSQWENGRHYFSAWDQEMNLQDLLLQTVTVFVMNHWTIQDQQIKS